MYRFAPASRNETIVFGAARPGYTDDQVNDWLALMQDHGIRRVCCLLPESQLTSYSNLLDVYRQAFGADRLCWTPIEDFHIVEVKIFTNRILPFLQAADRLQEKTVVHCSGGIGRTGHILAAWLVAGREMAAGQAIESVKQTGRNPYEAVIAAPFKGRNPWRVAAELKELLEECDRLRSRSARPSTL